MNTRLLILVLMACLGLWSMEAAGAPPGGIPPGQAKKQVLDQQQQALEQEELTLAQTERQLRDQMRALLEQLRALNPNGATTQDWADLWADYQQYNAIDEDDLKDIYKDKLKSLRVTGVDKDTFKSQVKALLKAMEAVQKQQDALMQSWDTHDQKVQQLNNDQQNYNNNQNGKK